MLGKRSPTKSPNEPGSSGAKSKDAMPEVALAAIVSYKRPKEIDNFMNFMVDALDRNSNWLNGVVSSQTNFRCALMVGAGPNRFQLHQTIYPNTETEIKLEVEPRDSEDHDKVAMAALVKLTSSEIDHLLKYTKTHLYDNPILREDLFKGKAMGISFAILRPFCEKQYRIMDRIVIGSATKCIAMKKRRRDERSTHQSPLKKSRRM